MSDPTPHFDLGDILELAVFCRNGDRGEVRPVGRLPNWWAESLARISTTGATEFRDPFLVDFQEAASEVWSADHDGSESSGFFEVEADATRMLLQAVAVRKRQAQLLIVRNLECSDEWLKPVLQAARTRMLQNEKDRVAHAAEVTSLTEDRDEAKRRERVQSRVLANLGHEIRTPLATILSMIEAAQRVDVKQQREYLQAIQSAAQQLLVLGNDVLDLSKIKADRLELDLQPFSLPDFLNEFRLQWSSLAREAQLGFDVRLDADVPPTVCGDAHRLRQVLSNLLANAIKFTESGSVSVSVGRSPQGEPHLRFSVTDTGSGIHHDDLPLIFEAYTQVDQSQRRNQGAGLGLAIAARLVRLMGGEIEVESQPGQGSEFRFDARLPDAKPALTPSATEQAECQTAGQLRELRALVADDHTVNRTILSDVLRRAGADVVEAENGQEAVELCRAAAAFDVVLMDRKMPVLDGLRAIQQIRQLENRNAQVPILVLTAHAFRAEHQEALSHGASACLTKPIKPHDLVRQILDLVNARRGQSMVVTDERD